MSMRQRISTVSLTSLVLATALLASVEAPSASGAWTAPCISPWSNKFLGNGRSASGLIGVYSEIEYINKKLCVQSPTGTRHHSWSLSWISLDGPQAGSVPGIDIFQGGYAKCPDPVASLGSCPFNNGLTYYWVYYAHEQGACGLAFNTGIIKIANAVSGTHDFQVSKVGTNYNFYIDEVFEYGRPQADIATCWPGVAAVEWQNEMLNNGDQGGGPLSNHQSFGSNQYQNGSGWHPENRALGAYCDANSYPAAWHCRTSSVTANNFNSWDDRAP